LFSRAREHRAWPATRKASSLLAAHKSIHRFTVGSSSLTGYALMKKFVGLLLCLSLGFFIVARAAKPSHTPAAAAKAAQTKATEQKANAETLLNDASEALVAMIKAARADSGLDPDIARNKPFWKSTQLIARNLRTAKTGLAAQNDDFFKGIAEARRAQEQMKIDWQLTNSKNKQVIENGKKLGDTIALLRTNYSKEAARKKTGGEMTANEKADFEKIKAQQNDLLAKISKLEKSAQKDKELERGLREIQKRAKRVVIEPATVDAYIATLYLLDVQVGLIRGYEYYVDKPWRAAYLGLVDWVTGYDTWYYTWYDTVSYDWAWVDTSVDVYQDITVSESISEDEISSEESYAESESFDMSEAEEERVAAEEEANEQVTAAGNIMEGVSDDEDEESDYSGANDVDDEDTDNGGGD
jgi:hypothetical protein